MTDEDRPDPRTEGPGSSPDDEVWAGIIASFHASPSLPDDLTGKDADPLVGGHGDLDDIDDHDDAPEWGEGHSRPDGSPGTPGPARGGAHRRPAGSPPSGGAADREEHFEPPPIPPSPPLHPVSRLAWWGTLGGPLVLLLAAVVGWDAPGWLVGLAAVAFMAGFVTLVARMRGRDDPDDGDDGAVV